MFVTILSASSSSTKDVCVARSSVSRCLSAGQSLTAMEMLSTTALSYCHVGKNEAAACRSLLTLCKWLLADWKDMTPQLKQACFQHKYKSHIKYF